MINRREFLKLAVFGAGTLAFRPLNRPLLPDFPQGDKLGRITVGKIDLFARPEGSGQPIGALYEDNLVTWIHEMVGSMPGRINQRFVETPNGFVWGGYVQPVWNKPSIPITSLP